jgi:hypothetical protein
MTAGRPSRRSAAKWDSVAHDRETAAEEGAEGMSESGVLFRFAMWFTLFGAPILVACVAWTHDVVIVGQSVVAAWLVTGIWYHIGRLTALGKSL